MKYAALLLAAGTLAAQSSTVNVQVENQTDTSLGFHGRLKLAMSTSFQLAEWSYQFFDQAPKAGGPLNALQPFHTRVQVMSQGIPLSAAGWDFSELDTMFSPVQAAGDHSPEFQIGTAPSYMTFPAGIPDFARMSARLVQYYNAGGFDDSGRHYRSPTPYPVTWWGIFNEPDINGVSADQYVSLYNTVVPAMAQADPSVKFVAVELAGAPDNYLPVFVAGVNAPVDVVAKHFYATCSQRDPDQTLFTQAPVFAAQVRTMYAEMAANPALAGVPVWITENNVNADYDKGGGISACNAPQKFVLDTRGTDAFFAAWRTLVFQQLGQAGAQALYHWGFGTDAEFGEVDASANPYLSYWVDYYLSHWLPSPPGQDILQVTTSGCCAAIPSQGWFGGALPFDTQTMAARNADGSVVVLMSNYALHGPYDNNGPGQPRTFALDVSSLGDFHSATLVTLDAGTPSTGPVPQPLTPSPRMQVTLSGYGAAFLRLSNADPVLPAAGVVNAASFAGGAVAPGEIVSLFGTALGPAAGVSLTLTNPWLASNSLEGVHVLFDGVPAPLTWASAGQINAVVPYAVAGHSSTSLELEYLGARSAPVTLAVSAAAPGIFTATGTGHGQGSILNVAGSSVNSAANPVARGAWVSLFGTGGGTLASPGVDGMLAAGAASINAAVTVKMDGIDCATNYAGAAPYLISGVLQINAQVPQGVTPGPDVPLEVTVGGVSAQTGLTLAVK